MAGTDGSQTAADGLAGRGRPGPLMRARLHIVSAYEPVAEQRSEEQSTSPRTCNGRSGRAREVLELLEQARDTAAQRRAARSSRGAAGRCRRRHPRRGRGTARGPDRRGQQGHDRRQALPARLGPEQGLPPRTLFGADRAHDLTCARFRSPLWAWPCGGGGSSGAVSDTPAVAAAASSRP